MKLDTNLGKDIKPEGFDEKSFSIENPAMVFDILRSKIYSDPILAVCREYLCNALDSHRENNTPDVPIEISIPTYDNLYFTVKDYGTGISPERMENVFIKYTASTKRDDNNQIGGFGLGGKAAFAYSDSFNVITNYNSKKYNYICFIDESKIGKMTLITEEDTSEPNGTTIVVPLKSSADISNFHSRIERVCKHWEVKPKITNYKLTFANPTKILQGDDWYISPCYSSYDRKVNIIIDNIEYPIGISTFLQHVKSEELKALKSSYTNPIKGDINLLFKTGELSLSVNREQLFFDERTIRNLTEKAVVFYNQLKQKIKDEVFNQPSYLEACMKYNSLFEVLEYPADWLENQKYNDLELCRHISGQGYMNVFAGNNSKFYNNYKAKKNVYSIKRATLNICENTLVVINDINISRVSIRHMQKFWDKTKNPSVVVADASNKDNEDFIKKYNAINLSKYCRVNNRDKKEVVKTNVYKMDAYSGKFIKSSLHEFESIDDADKYICKPYGPTSFYAYNNTTSSYKELQKLAPGDYNLFYLESPNEAKLQELIEGIDDISVVYENAIKEVSMQDLYKYHMLGHISAGYDRSIINAIKDMIISADSMVHKYDEYLQMVNAIGSNEVLSIVSKFVEVDDAGASEFKKQHSNLDFTTRTTEFWSTYPMLKLLSKASSSSMYYLRSEIDTAKTIANYINMIDASV